MGKFRNVTKVKNVSKVEKKTLVKWDEALKQFLLFKQAQNLSETTIDDYVKQINHFFKNHPRAFNDADLEDAVLEYMSQPIKPATYNIRYNYLKAFFNWCVEKEILKNNPILQLKKRKCDDKIVDVPIEAIKKLLKLPDKKTFAGLRDYALMLLQLDTGIRPGEAFQLVKEDINFNSHEVYVRDTVAKTRIKRTLPIRPETVRAIKRLIDCHHPAWGDDCPVFCSSEGTPLRRHTWGKRVRDYAKIVGIDISPYSFRHIFALNYLRNGGDALHLKRILGHTSLAMTNKYVALTQTDIKEQHIKASPLNIFLHDAYRVRKIKRP